MSHKIDHSLHWTEHYVEHGFAVVEKAVEPQWIELAMREVARLLNTDLPPHAWSVDTISVLRNHILRLHFDAQHMSVLPGAFDQPGVRAVFDTMFGARNKQSDDRVFRLFVTTFNADAKPRPVAHLDFVSCPIPVLGSGFVFQLSLVDSEANGGNMLVYPGTHKRVLKALIENPELRYPRDLQPLLDVEPYEFVARAGDMLLVHHLVGHSSSFNRAAHHAPRVVIHGQAARDEWLTEIDAAMPGLSPWERSLAVAGSYRDARNEKQIMLDYWQQRKAA